MWHATIGRGAWTALIAGFGLVLTAVAVDANDEGYVERTCLGQGSTRSAWSGRHRGPSTGHTPTVQVERGADRWRAKPTTGGVCHVPAGGDAQRLQARAQLRRS